MIVEHQETLSGRPIHRIDTEDVHGQIIVKVGDMKFRLQETYGCLEIMSVGITESMMVSPRSGNVILIGEVVL